MALPSRLPQRRPADQVELATLFAAHERQLGRYLAQLVDDRSLAEDLLQDTFVAVLRSGQSLDEVENPAAWLFAIARNRGLAALRRRRRLAHVLSRLRPTDVADQEAVDIVAVRDLLARSLTPDDRSLLLLRHLHGFDSAELAAMTGLSREAVRQRLSRARARVLAAAGERPIAAQRSRHE